MNGYKIPAVVIGGGANGLGIIRNLGSNGIDVFCAVDNKSDIAIYSKYCKGYSICPGIESEPHILNNFLKNFEKRLRSKAVLFPTSDFSVLNVSKLRDEFDKYEVIMPKHEALETLIIKRKFYASLKKMGIPHPTTLYPDNENFEEVEKKLHYPVFIKPSISSTLAEKFPGKKGFIANSEKELQYYLSFTKMNQIDVMIQEIVQGPFENLYVINGYFDKNSRPIILLAVRKLIGPTLFDNASISISIPISDVPEIKEKTIQYLTSINYSGIFAAGFKKDFCDQNYKFLEVNARSWMTNAFPTACGVNIILIAYFEAIGKKIEPIEKYETGIYSIYLLRDIVTMLSKDADLNMRLSFQKRLNSIKGKKCWIDFARKDGKPFLVSLSNLLSPF